MKTEFLMTNGLGGYSSADSFMGNTRKYHGLLVVADHELTRYCVLNRLDEFIDTEKERLPLSTNLYKDNTVFPKGYSFLREFSQLYFPKWHFVLKNIKVTKSIVMPYKTNKIIVKYDFDSKIFCTLKVQPLFTYRNHHALNTFQSIPFLQFENKDHLIVKFTENAFLKVYSEHLNYLKSEDIYKDFYYPIEEERGYDAHEDLIKLGEFSFSIPKGQSSFTLSFDFFTDPQENKNQTQIEDPFIEFNERLIKISENFHKNNNIPSSKFSEDLIRQSDQFIVKQNNNISVIAGYHWFSDWGRDTFISFKGLFLLTNRLEEAKNLLLRWKDLFKNGLIPNRPYSDDYNSVDAVFWYAVAVWEYYQFTKDIELIKLIVEKLEETLLSLHSGVYGLSIDKKGYLVDNNESSALTWMDAKINDKAVVDRSGRAVELQALWYNFLRITINLKEIINDYTHLSLLKKRAVQLETNFENDFFNPKTGCLFDRYTDQFKDPTIRANQIIPLALPFLLLGKRNSKRVLAVIEYKLLTDVGLKTLDPKDINYKPAYYGNQENRDLAYHQGAVWPFLLGLYLTAYLVTNAFSLKSKKYVQNKLERLSMKTQEDGIFILPEIYNQKTLKPDGCISQAWSVATIISTISLLNEE